MDNDLVFEMQPDYEVPLLRLLAELPGGRGRTADVCRRFEVEYRHRIPREHYETQIGKEPKWRNNVRWCRKALIERGLVEAPAWGVWQINEAGRRWLEDNPDVVRIPGSASALVRKRRPIPIPRSASSAGRKTRYQPDRPARAPEMTLEQLEEIRKLLPEEQFRQVLGSQYDQLLAEERAKTITTVSQTELGRRTRQRLDEIHSFLQGKNASTPSSEVLCDWLHFCYDLELYREAITLFTYIQENEVESGTYRRVKRIAEVSRRRLAG